MESHRTLEPLKFQNQSSHPSVNPRHPIQFALLRSDFPHFIRSSFFWLFPCFLILFRSFRFTERMIYELSVPRDDRVLHPSFVWICLPWMIPLDRRPFIHQTRRRPRLTVDGWTQDAYNLFPSNEWFHLFVTLDLPSNSAVLIISKNKPVVRR